MHFWFFGSGDTYHDVDSFSYFIVELGRKVSYISQIYIHALNLATVCVKTAGLKVHPIARASTLFSKSQQQMESRYLGNFWKSQTNRKKNLLSRSSIAIASLHDRSSLVRFSSFCEKNLSEDRVVSSCVQ